MEPPLAAVFDLDGVVFDTTERLSRCLQEAGASTELELTGAKRKAFWECFLSSKYMFYDKPNRDVVERIRELHEKGVKIIILSGRRMDTQGELTLLQLYLAGIPYDEIYLRAPRDYRRDAEYKSEILERLKHKYRIIELWDDSTAVIQVARKILPETKIIQYAKKPA